MRLDDHQEIVGQLKQIEKSDKNLELTFHIIKKVVLPKNKIDFEKIESCVDKEIGMLHLDGDYHIRLVKTEDTGNMNYEKMSLTELIDEAKRRGLI